MDRASIIELVELARLAPSADNTQPSRMEWDGLDLSVCYHSARVSGKTFPAESPATLLAVGALIENLMVVAEAWHLGPQLTLASAPGADSRIPYAHLRFQSDGQPASDADTAAIVARHTDRGPYKTTSLPDAICSQLADRSLNSARSWFSQTTSARKSAANLVNRASRIRFRTREVHEWLGKSLRFSPAAVATGDGLDVATLALPPGGSAFLRLIADWQRLSMLNHFGAYRLLAAIDSAPIRRGPGLLAIIATDDARGALDAGRLLARQWTWLNQQGIAVHPYYVVADQLERVKRGTVPPELTDLAREVAAGSEDLFGLQTGETLHMLLRVGYSRSPPKRSLRLPVGELFLDTTSS